MKVFTLPAIVLTCSLLCSSVPAADNKPSDPKMKSGAASDKAPAAAGASAPTGSTSTEKPKAAARPLPYQGTVYRVDSKNNKFTTRTKAGKVHTFRITEKTVFLKDDKPAALTDVKPGEIVRGSRYKKGDADWEAIKVIIGAKKAPEDRKED